MELKAENVKNIRSLAVCKEFLRQAIEQNDQLKSDYEEACGRLQTANLIKNEQLAATRHQKYKRCLAMAEWCNSEIGIADTDGDYEDMRRYQKWHERWLKLSEKFKEAKCR